MSDTEIEATLYVERGLLRSEAAIRNISDLLLDVPARHLKLNIIDVSESPERAFEASIFFIPTLVREKPEPEIRITGDLSKHAEVRMVLNLPNSYEDISDDQGKAEKGE